MDWRIVNVISIIAIVVILYYRRKKGEDIFKNILPMIITMGSILLIMLIISRVMK